MRIVDTHAHVIPPGFVTAMRSGDAPDGITIEDVAGSPWVVHRQGYRYPLPPHFYDVSARLAHMDAMGVSAAVLSIAPPMFLYWVGADEAVDVARTINDELAAMVENGDGRLSAVATLPMQDPNTAATELRRAVTELGLRGAQIGPHIEGIQLDDPRFRPVLATAEDLNVPLLLHPYYVGAAHAELADYYLTNLLGNPWQTAVAASRLILSGTLDDHPSLDLVLVHGGGHLPYQCGRLDHGHRVRPEAKTCRDLPSSYLRRFHYDTLTHHPSALQWLIDLVGADRVVYGSDVPFDMGGGPLFEQLGDHQLDDDSLAHIAHRNADRLFSLEGAVRHG